MTGYRVERRRIDLGDRALSLLVLRPTSQEGPLPGVLWAHGGGYCTGMASMAYFSRPADLARTGRAVVVCPSYRLAPIHPYPEGLLDCYAALLWLQEHAEELGVASDQLFVGGESAGGGLAAAVCVMARDRGEVNVAFQMPLYPMLDNLDTESSRDNHGRVWNTRKNHMGWRMYLRKDAKKDVSPYAAPARQRDWRGLPPAYTFVCQGEPFYRETLDYVENLKAAGVEAEADVYHTDAHAFDMLWPEREPAPEAIRRFHEKFERAMACCR